MNSKLPTILVCFFLPMLSFSQSLTELKQEKQKIQQKIEHLEDSLDLVADKIEKLEEQQEPKKDLVEVVPEVSKWILAKDVALLAAPAANGKTIRDLKKGTVVQKVDKLGKYYLICISGSCGYVGQDSLQKNVVQKKEIEKRTKDGRKDKELVG